MNLKSPKMSVAVNRSTKELIGYNKAKKILVIAYAVDDLQKKFNAELKRIADEKNYVKNHAAAMKYMADNEMYGGSLGG
jgi:heme-binding NEAT domain protein